MSSYSKLYKQLTRTIRREESNFVPITGSDDSDDEFPPNSDAANCGQQPDTSAPDIPQIHSADNSDAAGYEPSNSDAAGYEQSDVSEHEPDCDTPDNVDESFVAELYESDPGDQLFADDVDEDDINFEEMVGQYNNLQLSDDESEDEEEPGTVFNLG